MRPGGLFGWLNYFRSAAGGIEANSASDKDLEHQASGAEGVGNPGI